MAQIGYLKLRDLDLGSQLAGLYSAALFLTFKGSTAAAFMLIFDNNWIDVFYKSLHDFGETAVINFFCIVLLTKQILSSILVAFLLEHIKQVVQMGQMRVFGVGD